MVGGYDNDVDVDMLAGNSDVSKHGCVGLVPDQQPLVKSPTQDEFRETWSEAILKNTLLLSFVDDPLFRKTLVTTSLMGQTDICMGLLLQLHKMYSEPINVKQSLALDENIRRKIQKVFMHRWSVFHAPIHSVAFAMDRQFCRRQMDAGIKKDIWSVMEDFSKAQFFLLEKNIFLRLLGARIPKKKKVLPTKKMPH